MDRESPNGDAKHSVEEEAVPSGKKGLISRQMKTLVTAVATVVILWALMAELAEFQTLAARLQEARVSFFGITSILLVVFIYLAGLRWQYIVQTMGYPLSMKRTMYVVLVSCPMAIATPSRMSDFVRAIGIQDIVPVWKGSSSVVVYKLVDVQSLCLLGVVGGVVTGLYGYAALILVALISGSVVLLLIHRNRERVLEWPILERFSDRLLQLFSAFESMMSEPWKFGVLSLMSLIAWSLAMAILYTLTEALGAGISLGDILALWPIAVFVGLLPITLGGVGTRDSAFLGLLLLTGQTVDEASTIAATLLYSLAVLVIPAVVGLPFMFHFFKNIPEPIDPDETQAEALK